MFPSRQLKGHNRPITCFASTKNDNEKRILASGSEDRTVRLWDCNEQKSVKCFHKCFPGDIESIQFHPLKPYLLYVASGNRMFSFDIRNDAILQSTAFSMAEGFDDINCININHNGTQLAIADDSSLVYLMRLNEDGSFQPMGKQTRALQRVHENMVGTVSFANINKKNQIYTGGYDYICCNWDVDRCRPIKSVTIQTLAENETHDSANSVFNPPFINHLQVLEDKQLIALALGDGSLRLLRSNGLATVYASTVHAGPITAMHTVQSNYLISGSIDCMIHGWEVTSSETAAQPQKGKKKGNSNNNSNNNNSDPAVKLQSLWSIHHTDKINALYCDMDLAAVVAVEEGLQKDLQALSVNISTETANAQQEEEEEKEQSQTEENFLQQTQDSSQNSNNSSSSNRMHVYTADTTNLITLYYVQ